MLLDEALINRLRTHVERLAGDIGERNVFVPEALRRAATVYRGGMDEVRLRR